MASKNAYSRPARRTPPPDEVWLYGTHAVLAALANPEREKKRLVTSRNAVRSLEAPPVEPEILEPDRIARLLPPGAVHQGIALLTAPLDDPDLSITCRNPARFEPVVILDQVTDPHNVGAILRSCAAFGARALVMTERRSPPSNGTLAKVAAGALETVPLVRVRNLATAMGVLQEMGYWLLGLDEDGSGTIAGALESEPAAVGLVLGAEGAGLRELTGKTCDALVRLPTQAGFSSLNVSNAAAIALYETVRARPV